MFRVVAPPDVPGGVLSIVGLSVRPCQSCPSHALLERGMTDMVVGREAVHGTPQSGCGLQATRNGGWVAP